MAKWETYKKTLYGRNLISINLIVFFYMYIFNKLNKYIYYITIYNIYIFYFLFLFSLSKHSLNLFSVFHSDTPRLGLGLLPLLVINDTAAAAAAAPLPPCFTPLVRPLSAARWDVTIW